MEEEILDKMAYSISSTEVLSSWNRSVYLRDFKAELQTLGCPTVIFLTFHPEARLRVLAASLASHNRDIIMTSNKERTAARSTCYLWLLKWRFLYLGNYPCTLKNHPILVVTDKNLNLGPGFSPPRILLSHRRYNNVFQRHLLGARSRSPLQADSLTPTFQKRAPSRRSHLFMNYFTNTPMEEVLIL